MKTLVVYYSRTGHTKKVAEAIATELGCEIEQIIDEKDRSGIWGWVTAGGDSTRGKLTKIKDVKRALGSYDLVIVGGPIWAFTVSAPVRAFLTRYSSQCERVAFFCTQSGSGAERAFKSMREISGKSPVATMKINERELGGGVCLEKVKDFVSKIG